MIVNPKLRGAGVLAVHRRRRTDHSGPAVPVRLHHDRLRRDLRLPRADLDRHDVEDGRQGERHPADRLRRDAVRGRRRRRWRSSPPRALHPGDYFAINTRRQSFRTLGMPIVNLPELQSEVGENVVGPAGRRGVARGRHGADLQRPARHARPDGLLVPLRDHVRGAVHPDDDRLRHARRPVPAAGVRRPRLEAVRANRLAAGHARSRRRDRARRGAISSGPGTSARSGRCSASRTSCSPSWRWRSARRSSSTSGARSTRGSRSCRSASSATTTLTAGYMSVRDNFWPMAIGAEPGAARAGLRRLDLHRDHDGLRGDHPGRHGPTLHARDERARFRHSNRPRAELALVVPEARPYPERHRSTPSPS